MVAACISPPVLHLAMNRAGRDFAVGDLHGCVSLLDQALARVGFDPSVDRLFIVGDLIDRGGESDKAARLLARAGVYAVRGNHEDVLVEIHEGGDPHPGTVGYLARTIGFGWWLETPRPVQLDILRAARALPLAIEVETDQGLVGVVHADVPFGLSWPAMVAALEAGDEVVMKDAMWSRDRVTQGDTVPVAGVWRVYTGHTPVASPLLLGNVCNIDTGAVFGVLGRGETGALTLVDLIADQALIEREASQPQPTDLLRVISPRAPAPTLRPAAPGPFERLRDLQRGAGSAALRQRERVSHATRELAGGGTSDIEPDRQDDCSPRG